MRPPAAYSTICNAAVYNVRDLGAKGDGQHIDSDAINEAIQRAADDGGGTVVVSQGTFLCYSIHLKSDIILKLEEGMGRVPTPRPQWSLHPLRFPRFAGDRNPGEVNGQ